MNTILEQLHLSVISANAIKVLDPDGIKSKWWNDAILYAIGVVEKRIQEVKNEPITPILWSDKDKEITRLYNQVEGLKIKLESEYDRGYNHAKEMFDGNERA